MAFPISGKSRRKKARENSGAQEKKAEKESPTQKGLTKMRQNEPGTWKLEKEILQLTKKRRRKKTPQKPQEACKGKKKKNKLEKYKRKRRTYTNLRPRP